MILKGLEVGPFACNCYIVGSETTKEGMVIDPGEEADIIVEQVKELGLTIKLIVLTHSHIDHLMALKTVKEATGADLAVHADEARGLGKRVLANTFGLTVDPPPVPDRELHGGDSIELGELKFLVLHTPGHSPGGISLYGHGVVFTGDALFQMGIGRTDFPGSSYAQLINSIYTKLMVLPPQTMVLPGHGPQSTIGFELQSNPFLRTGMR